MNLGRCPVCHSRLHLDAIIQDDAARELLTIVLALEPATARALTLYLGLFRPAKRDLDNARAVRLAREALALGEGLPPGVLAAAMAETVEAIRRKGLAKPMDSHNYLKSVAETRAAAAQAPASAPDLAGDPAPLVPSKNAAAPSKTLLAMAKLQSMKIPET